MKIKEYIKKILFTKSCKFNDIRCLSKDRFLGCICGKGGDSEPARVDPVAEANANVAAQQAGIRPAAQIQFDLLNDPNIGLQAQTQLQENVRKNVFTGEQAIREGLQQRILGDIQDPSGQIARQQQGVQQQITGREQLFPEQTQLQSQLFNNVLQNLVSPTGVTSEQQAAVDANRARAQSELVKSIRTRENLGGNLFGGKSATREGRLVSELLSGFAESDIERDRQNRQSALASALQLNPQLLNNLQQLEGQQQNQELNQINQALPFLQLLFPQSQIQSPQFINPVVSANQQFSGAVGQRGQDIQAQSAQQQAKAQQTSALFSALGMAAGGLAAGPAGAALGAKLGGGGLSPQSQAIGMDTRAFQ